MKNTQKRKLSILLLLALLLSLLAGCATGENAGDPTNLQDPTKNPSSNPTNGPTDEDPVRPEKPLEITCQYLPQTVENPQDLPVLKWVCLTDLFVDGTLKNEAAVVELNQMLADKNMPFRVQFVIMKANNGTLKWLEQPEAQAALQDADLVFGYFTAGEMVQNLLPITEYVKGTAQPSLQGLAVHPEYWWSTTVRDEIYGMMGMDCLGESVPGWRVSEKVFTEYGLTVEDFMTLDRGQIYAKLYEKNGNQPLGVSRDGMGSSVNLAGGVRVYTPSLSVGSDTLQTIGYCFAIDYTQAVPKVVNYLDTDEVRALREQKIQYIEAGYLSENGGVNLFAGSARGNFTYTKDGMVNIPLGPREGKQYSSAGHVTGIAAGTQHKEEALTLLSLIADDEAFRMQLLFGKEGRDYKIVDGCYKKISQEDGSSYNMSFLSTLAYFCDDFFRKAPVVPAETPEEFLKNHLAVLDSTVYKKAQYPVGIVPADKAAGYLYFDFSGFETELEAMVAVMQTYFDKFSKLSDQEYAQMLQDLEAAGSGKVLASLQQQLEAWQAENPNFLPPAA